jgi:hypothetical protein
MTHKPPINTNSITTINSAISNIDNTSDLNKPISASVQTALTNLEAGVTYKNSVFANTTGPLPSNVYTQTTYRIESSANGILNISSAVVGDIILVKNEVETRANGIYDIISVGSASTNWVLIRSSNSDGTTSSELAGGNVVSSINPVIAQYVLTDAGTKLVNDPVLLNNSVLTYSLFGSSVPPNLNISTLDTSGVCNVGGALNILNNYLTSLSGALNVTGVCSFGSIATLNISGVASIGGTGTVFRRF